MDGGGRLKLAERRSEDGRDGELGEFDDGLERFGKSDGVLGEERRRDDRLGGGDLGDDRRSGRRVLDDRRRRTGNRHRGRLLHDRVHDLDDRFGLLALLVLLDGTWRSFGGLDLLVRGGDRTVLLGRTQGSSDLRRRQDGGDLREDRSKLHLGLLCLLRLCRPVLPVLVDVSSFSTVLDRCGGLALLLGPVKGRGFGPSWRVGAGLLKCLGLACLLCLSTEHGRHLGGGGVRCGLV